MGKAEAEDSHLEEVAGIRPAEVAGIRPEAVADMPLEEEAVDSPLPAAEEAPVHNIRLAAGHSRHTCSHNRFRSSEL